MEMISITQNPDASDNPPRRRSARLCNRSADVGVAVSADPLSSGDSSRRRSARLSRGDTSLGIRPSLPPPQPKKRGRSPPRRSIALGLNPNPSPSANPLVTPDEGREKFVDLFGEEYADEILRAFQSSAPRKLVTPLGAGKMCLDFHCTGSLKHLMFKISCHELLVETGEDILSKLKNFMPHRPPRYLYILWAKGAVSNATICTSSGDFVTYEGHSELVSLEGKCFFPRVYDAPVRKCVVSAYIAGPDGRVVGGLAEGELVAASPVEVTLFGVWNVRDKEASGVPSLLNFVAPVPPANAPSQGPSIDLSCEKGAAGSAYGGGSGPCTDAIIN